MSCPICDNKPMNCDCTSLEKEQFYEIEDLSAEVEKLRDWQKRAVEEIKQSFMVLQRHKYGYFPEAVDNAIKRLEQLIEEAK